MKCLIAAVGRLKDSGERELFDRYGGRFDQAGRAIGLGPLTVTEFPESRKPVTAERKAEEAARLIAATDGPSVARIVLDERGKPEDSAAFAHRLGRLRDDGFATVAFLLGGPDGHGEAALGAASVRLSLGPMTLPHGLARVVLAEQLYRAVTILSGHPYHRV